MNKYTIRDFDRDFPDDGACLDWLKDFLYPAGIPCKVCGEVTKHYRVKSRPSYSCSRCGHHVHPMAGTIYEDSRTPLKLWFYATYIMAQTRCGISAKQLQRETGVTYKTAWRMFRQIRSLLDEPTAPMSGQVEVDETYMGGKRKGRIGRGIDKTPVVGVVQRGGRVVATKTPDVTRATVLPLIRQHVMPRSIVYTDEYRTYNTLPAHGYAHHRIHHSSKVYVRGDVHTNTIEGFWSLVKRGIGGVYHSVSDKYLQSYLNEYAFRYNHREDERPMFQSILARIQKA
ncbi:MAG: IS1595 family transposase [Dehalococcoidia bacterium]|nr:IS1595 family transposase [Dehalococcoidia bacterium]